MTETFEQLLSSLSKDEYLYQSVEEATRQGVILPILAQLGWNVYNIREVVPEFPVEKRRVDYCLKIGEKNAVFLEVKRINEDLEQHEEQLLHYSFKYGVDIAVLTNGLIWWFYLPLVSGSWQQRKFFTIDIKQQIPEKAVRHFMDFLSRDGIADGRSVRLAKSVLASKEKEHLINRTIPIAWERILREPDETFLDYFATKVESICGHRPEPQALVNFIHNTPSGHLSVTTIPSKVIQKTDPPRLKAQPELAQISRRNGVSIIINDKEFIATSVRDLYQQVLRYLCENGYIEMLEPVF